MSSPDFEHRDALPHGPAHRRGAGLNPGNRFETTRLHVSGEHYQHQHDAARWEREGQEADDHASAGGRGSGSQKTTEGGGTSGGEITSGGGPVRVPLEVIPDATRSIINRVDRTSDVPFDWTLNPYRGCEHGCIYCFARPYHEYLGYSCGLDFETKLVAKHDAPEMLRRELARPSWKAEPIVMSAITDIYQPIEYRLRLARRCLEVLAECGQPVSTMTKSALVLRDLDLWSAMSRRGTGRVTVTLVTLDDQLAKTLEPRAASPARRLRVIRELAGAGVDVSVNVAPVIPGLTDSEVPRILEAVAAAGATRAAWVLLRLPYQLKALFLDWLERSVHPDRARKVESLIRQARGGLLYRSGFPRGTAPGVDDDTSRMVATRDTATSRNPVAALPGDAGRRDHDRYRGEGPRAEQIGQAFALYCRKYGLNRDVRSLTREHFRPPALGGQMTLF